MTPRSWMFLICTFIFMPAACSAQALLALRSPWSSGVPFLGRFLSCIRVISAAAGSWGAVFYRCISCIRVLPVAACSKRVLDSSWSCPYCTSPASETHLLIFFILGCTHRWRQPCLLGLSLLYYVELRLFFRPFPANTTRSTRCSNRCHQWLTANTTRSTRCIQQPFCCIYVCAHQIQHKHTIAVLYSGVIAYLLGRVVGIPVTEGNLGFMYLQCVCKVVKLGRFNGKLTNCGARWQVSLARWLNHMEPSMLPPMSISCWITVYSLLEASFHACQLWPAELLCFFCGGLNADIGYLFSLVTLIFSSAQKPFASITHF